MLNNDLSIILEISEGVRWENSWATGATYRLAWTSSAAALGGLTRASRAYSLPTTLFITLKWVFENDFLRKEFLINCYSKIAQLKLSADKSLFWLLPSQAFYIYFCFLSCILQRLHVVGIVFKPLKFFFV